MANFRLGMNAKAYFENAATGLQQLDELGEVRDVNLNLEAGEADITTRANGGWRGTAATLRECSAEFEMVYKHDDVGYQKLRTAYLTGGEVEMAFLTGPRSADGIAAEVGSEGPMGVWCVTNFSRSEPLEEGVVISATCKLATFSEWIIDGLETP